MQSAIRIRAKPGHTICPTIAFPPETQELRARKIGNVIANSAQDRPWSNYFCCVVAGNMQFVRKYPAATKRVLRAILKATGLCVSEPRRVAQLMIEQGYSDYVDQTLNELPYAVWRDYDPEDTIRFYGLRMHELGMIKSSPQKLIAEHTRQLSLCPVSDQTRAH